MCRKLSVESLETLNFVESDDDPYAMFHAPWADVSFVFDLREAGPCRELKEKKSKGPLVRLPVPRNCCCSVPKAPLQLLDVKKVKRTVPIQKPSSEKRKRVKTVNLNEIDEDTVLVPTDSPFDKKKRRLRPRLPPDNSEMEETGKEITEASSLQNSTGPNDRGQTDEDLDEVQEIDEEEWERSLTMSNRNAKPVVSPSTCK
jgi:hypothetical protein